MNKLYKIVFNKNLGLYVVTSENAKSCGKTSTVSGSTKPTKLKKQHKALAVAFKVGTLLGCMAMACSPSVYANLVVDGTPDPNIITNSEDYVIVGQKNIATNTKTISMYGINNTAQNAQSIFLSGNSNSVISYLSTTPSVYMTLVGMNQSATNSNHVSSLGVSNTFHADYVGVLGELNQVGHYQDFKPSYVYGLGFNNKIGTTAKSKDINFIATNSTLDGSNIYAIGTNLTATGDNNVLIGGNNRTIGSSNTAVGQKATVEGSSSTAIGANSTAMSNKSTAVGYIARANADSSVAVGNQATVSAGNANSVALGSNSNANGVSITQKSYLTDSTARAELNISNGSDGRRITGVADGALDTDAATIKQLKTLGSNSVQYNTDKSLVTLTGETGTKITNLKVADLNAKSTDAVTGAQLFETNEKVSQNKSAIESANTAISNNTLSIDNNTTNIQTNMDDIAKLNDKDRLNVKYSEDLSLVELKGEAGTRITNLSNGDVSEFSSDAVNGSQLFQTQQMVDQLNEAEGFNVKYNEDHTIVALTGEAGTKIVNLNKGEVSIDSKEAVNGSQLYLTNQNVDFNRNEIQDAKAHIEENRKDIATNIDDIAKLNEADKNNVKYNEDKSVVALAGKDGTTITNVKAGQVAKGSTDAVNGDQLFTTNEKVAQNKDAIDQANTDIQANKTAITTNTANIKINTGDIAKLNEADKNNVKYNEDKSVVALAGETGTKITHLSNGEVSETSNEAINGSQLFKTDSNVAQNKTDIENLYVADKYSVKYNEDKSEVILEGAEGTKISNLKKGFISDKSTDAVNGSQLYETNERVSQTETDISTNTTNIKINSDDIAKLNAADEFNVKYNTDKSVVALAGQDGTAITNLKAGKVAKDSTDAVNGSQLFTTNENVAQNKDAIDQANVNIQANKTAITTNADYIKINTGDIAKLNEADKSNVKYNTDKSVIALAGETGTKITHLNNGEVSETSNEAVNGSQLFKTEQQVEQNKADQAVIDKSQDDLIIKNNDSSVARDKDLQTGITTNTTNIKINSDDIAKLNEADKSNVKYNADKSVVALAGQDGTTITNVKAGKVAKGSTDGVNGDQLFTTNDNVAQNKKAIETNTADIKTNSDDIANLNEADKSNVKYNADKSIVALAGKDGTKITNVKAGQVAKGSTDAVNGEQLFDTQQMIKGVSESDANSVKYNADKSVVALAGQDGTTITNVKAGKVAKGSSDAVNGDQLFATNDKVAQNKDAIDQANTDIQANKTAITTNADNIKTNTANIKTNSDDIANLNEADKSNVKYNADKSIVALAGKDGTKITNMKNGEVTATSKDAVNGSQLYNTQQMIKDVSESDANSVKYNTDKSVIALAGTNGTTITNLKDGIIGQNSTDAISGGQIYKNNVSIASIFGGNAGISADGQFISPSYTLINAGGTFNNIGAALNALDTAIGNVDAKANGGWTLSGKAQDGSTTSQVVKPGASVSINGDSNVTVAHSTDKDGNASIDVSLNKDITVDSVTAGTVTADKVSVGGVTIDKNGIDAGGKQISGVANATSNDQAVNLGQAKEMIGQQVSEATAGAVQYDKDKDGKVNKDSISFEGTKAQVSKGENGVEQVTSGGTSLNNVANATQAHQAVNKGQLDNNTSNVVSILGGGASYNAETQQVVNPTYHVSGQEYHDVGSAIGAIDQVNATQNSRLDSLESAFYQTNERLETIRKDSNAGIAGAMAMGNLPQPNEGGSGMVSAGLSSFRGESAIAVGVSATSESNKVIWKFAGTADTRNSVGGAVSVGYQWK